MRKRIVPFVFNPNVLTADAATNKNGEDPATTDRRMQWRPIDQFPRASPQFSTAALENTDVTLCTKVAKGDKVMGAYKKGGNLGDVDNKSVGAEKIAVGEVVAVSEDGFVGLALMRLECLYYKEGEHPAPQSFSIQRAYPRTTGEDSVTTQQTPLPTVPIYPYMPQWWPEIDSVTDKPFISL